MFSSGSSPLTRRRPPHGERADAPAHSLRAIAERVARRGRGCGPRRRADHVERDRTEIVDDLARWLENEIARPGTFPQSEFEVAFGARWSGGTRARSRRDEPLEIAAAGTERSAPRPDRPASTGSPEARSGSSTTRRGRNRREGHVRRRPGAPAPALPARGREARRHRRQARSGLVPVRHAPRQFQRHMPSRERISSPRARHSTRCSTGSSAGSRAATSIPSRATTAGSATSMNLCDVGRVPISKRKSRRRPSRRASTQMREIT